MKDDDAKATKSHYRKLRKELAAMLGYGDDPDALPIGQSMRLDVVTNLKCALDEQRGRLYRGEAIDSAEMLRLSDALDRYLPKHPEPVESDPFEGVDPHKHLEDMLRRYWESKKATAAEQAAQRREQGLSEPFTDLDAAQARIDELEARYEPGNDRLRDDSPRALPSPETERVITPPLSDITPPGEIAKVRVGMEPGPDDHRANRWSTVIDGEVVKDKPAPQAAPPKRDPGSITEAEANAQGLRLARHDEPWRGYV